MTGFISTVLENCINSQTLKLVNANLILEIQEALMKGSQGMFLWVALQIKSLCVMRTDDDIRQALVDLPKSLPETFSRILQKAEVLGKQYQKRILELVSIAERP